MLSTSSLSSLVYMGIVSAFFCFANAVNATSPLQQHKFNQQKIIGGIQSEKDEYPFITALTLAGDTLISPSCGASYIGGRYVLTAAHCVDGVLANNIDVWIGGHDITNPEEGLRVSVNQIYMHEDYDDFSSNNDIAVLELSEVVTGVAALPLITPEIEALITEGVMMRIMGWGNTDDSTESGDYPNILRETDVPLYNRADCLAAYSEDGVSVITDQMMCAGFVAGGQDTCQGDSGGPMIYNHEGQWYQAGVVSFGNGCAVANFPGIYSRVSQFTQWVAQKTEGISYRQRIDVGFVESSYSDIQDVTITNISSNTYFMGQSLLTNEVNLLDVGISNDTCNTTSLAPGESCIVSVRTAPITTGDSSFTLITTTASPLNTEVEVNFTLSAMEQSSLDMPTLVDSPESLVSWFSGGNSVWEANSARSSQSGSSVSSGDITHFESSVLLATISNSRVQQVSFDYLVSSEVDYDFLNITLNGQKIVSESGNSRTTFTNLSVNLDPDEAVNRIAFSFDKDESIDGGDDKAYIDTVVLQVDNDAPVVSLSASQVTAEEATTFTVDASASSDPNSDALSYNWQVVGNANALIATQDSASTVVTAPDFSNAESFTLRVTVTDSFGATSTSDVDVTVTQAPSTTPVATPTPAAPSSSGGGSIGIFCVLACGIVALSRRPQLLSKLLNNSNFDEKKAV